MTSELEAGLTALAEAQVQALGLTLWGVEAHTGGGRQVIRVFVDKEGGVDVESCAKASRAIALALEVEDPIRGPFNLEVSSPGLERRFFTPEQARPWIGKTMEARLAQSLEGRRKLLGELTGLEGDRITLKTDDGREWDLAWNEIKRLHLVHEF